uniref:Putative secreted protein n=1 Tax=Anopheles triannulatus TaxID=58253 RepID=A0A2M4B1C6_9DIPT
MKLFHFVVHFLPGCATSLRDDENKIQGGRLNDLVIVCLSVCVCVCVCSVEPTPLLATDRHRESIFISPSRTFHFHLINFILSPRLPSFLTKEGVPGKLP